MYSITPPWHSARCSWSAECTAKCCMHAHGARMRICTEECFCMYQIRLYMLVAAAAGGPTLLWPDRDWYRLHDIPGRPIIFSARHARSMHSPAGCNFAAQRRQCMPCRPDSSAQSRLSVRQLAHQFQQTPLVYLSACFVGVACQLQQPRVQGGQRRLIAAAAAALTCLTTSAVAVAAAPAASSCSP